MSNNALICYIFFRQLEIYSLAVAAVRMSAAEIGHPGLLQRFYGRNPGCRDGHGPRQATF
jgi:hypothetical protein